MGAAERLYRAALALAERRPPSDDPLTARLRNDLGVLLEYTGHFDEARRLYMRSPAVLTARRPLSHPDIATPLHNLGGLDHAAGDPAAGEAPARAALSLRRSIGGAAEDPAAASDAAALAGILIATERHDEARAAWPRVIPTSPRSKRTCAGSTSRPDRELRHRDRTGRLGTLTVARRPRRWEAASRCS